MFTKLKFYQLDLIVVEETVRFIEKPLEKNKFAETAEALKSIKEGDIVEAQVRHHLRIFSL